LFNPIYVPMIVETRPWTSFSEGGYLVTPMKLSSVRPAKGATTSRKSRPVDGVYGRERAAKHTLQD